MPGKLLLVAVETGTLTVEYTAEQMELVPPVV
jgi:hypothetical protein